MTRRERGIDALDHRATDGVPYHVALIAAGPSQDIVASVPLEKVVALIETLPQKTG